MQSKTDGIRSLLREKKLEFTRFHESDCGRKSRAKSCKEPTRERFGRRVNQRKAIAIEMANEHHSRNSEWSLVSLTEEIVAQLKRAHSSIASTGSGASGKTARYELVFTSFSGPFSIAMVRGPALHYTGHKTKKLDEFRTSYKGVKGKQNTVFGDFSSKTRAFSFQKRVK